MSEVRTTTRLVDSAVVLAAGTAGPDLQMQRLLKRAGRMGMSAAPILEINARHALLVALGRRVAGGEDIKETAEMLFDLARVQDGELPRDPAAFARRFERILAGGEGPASAG